MFDSLWLHGLQPARLPVLHHLLGACSNSCPLSWWCYPTNSSSATPFSFCLQSFPASGSFLMSRLFASGGQSIGASASALILPVNIHGWVPLGLTGLISLEFKGLSGVFSSTTVRRHPFSRRWQLPVQNCPFSDKLLYPLNVCLNVMYAFISNDCNFSESLMRCKNYAQWKLPLWINICIMGC